MEHFEKKISIVGIGMDGEATLTQAGQRAIEAAGVLIGGSERLLQPFRHLGKQEYISYRPAAVIRECDYQKIVVLVSGDVGFYSVAETLLPQLTGYEVEVICGISTPIYFCAILHLSWSKLHFISLHGAKDNIVRNVCAHEYTFFLLGGDITPAAICRRLCEYGRGELTVHVGENFGSPDERVTSSRAEELADYPSQRLCAVIVENPHYERFVPCGIDDSEFVRGKVPMTKAEVRALCVAKLAIGAGDCCWDIGCGTGSVSVEMALQCTNGTVFSVDKKAEAVALTEANRKKFGCDNIEIFHSTVEEAIETLPAPDCVFVGGSSGSLDEVIRAAAAKNPHVKIVVTAVSLETLQQCTTIFDMLGFESEITQIAVTRTRKVGSHTMLSAENPIVIIKRKC